MKIATNQTRETILAEANAPEKAICPYCKGTVILRTRRRSDQTGAVTYFWRHENHTNLWCPARFKAVDAQSPVPEGEYRFQT